MYNPSQNRVVPPILVHPHWTLKNSICLSLFYNTSSVILDRLNFTDDGDSWTREPGKTAGAIIAV